MGVVARLARWTIGLGLAVLSVTVAAVLYTYERNLERHGEGRTLAGPVDAIVVLGTGADGDGVLGYSSRRRVAVAVDLLKAGMASNLILSGGAGGRDLPRIGPLMRDHAVALGAPAEALLVESRSLSTFENLRFSFEIAEARGLGRLALATDAFHLERAAWLAGYFGRPEIGLVAAAGFDRDPHAVQIWMILREATAWWLNLAKVAGWEILAAAGIDSEARREWIR